MLDIADPDRRLALAYVPAEARAEVAALFALDERLARIVAATREPMLGIIRLTWWRDALAALDGAAAPDEPLLQELARAVVARAIEGAVVARLTAGWEALLDGAHEDHAERGIALFEAGARLLGDGDTRLAGAGAGWAMADLAFHLRDPGEVERAKATARAHLASFGERSWPARLRPLTMLAALARRDAALPAGASRPLGSPGRAGRMAWHRLTGR